MSQVTRGQIIKRKVVVTWGFSANNNVNIQICTFVY